MGVQNDKNKRIVLEQFSQIEFSKSDGGYILHDLLRDIKFDINDTFFLYMSTNRWRTNAGGYRWKSRN